MKTFKTRGVVLREYNTGEADKAVILLLKERGRLRVSARGARKPSSKFMAATQLFTYSDFVIADGSSFYSCAQAEVIEPFFQIREDYGTFAAAAEMTRLCEAVTPEGHPNDDTCLLLLCALNALCKGRQPELVLAAFRLKLLQNEGLEPDTKHCAACNAPLAQLNSALAANAYGLLCPNCSINQDNFACLSPAARQIAEYVFTADIRSCLTFSAHMHPISEVLQYSNMLVQLQLDYLGGYYG